MIGQLLGTRCSAVTFYSTSQKTLLPNATFRYWSWWVRISIIRKKHLGGLPNWPLVQRSLNTGKSLKIRLQPTQQYIHFSGGMAEVLTPCNWNRMALLSGVWNVDRVELDEFLGVGFFLLLDQASGIFTKIYNSKSICFLCTPHTTTEVDDRGHSMRVPWFLALLHELKSKCKGPTLNVTYYPLQS